MQTNIKSYIQLSFIFFFFDLVGKGPGVLNTVLKEKHKLFKALVHCVADDSQIQEIFN